MSERRSVRVRPVFEYRGAAGAVRADPFGLWDFIPAPRMDGVSFALPGVEAVAPDEADISLWKVELPTDYGLALSHLRSGEERLLDSQRALTVAAQRLGSSPVSTAEAVAGEAVMADLKPLFGLLRGESRGVAFAPPAGLAGHWEEINGQFIAFIERARQTLTHYAWVETSVGGNLLSRTVVSWAGDMTTVWRATPATPQMALHRRSLALTLKSREALLRSFIVIAKGAVLLSSGVGVLALPLVWKYVQEMMSEITAWRRIANET
ncbi:MAG: hypothetical protein LC803_22670 [Acidobacteria bacterium]|nr:hypothetical protein [Acidobacteriota bacterium]